MAKATNSRERSEQKVWLKQAAEGRLGSYKDLPTELKKDLKADKAMYNLAVKNGVVPGARKPAAKTTKK